MGDKQTQNFQIIRYKQGNKKFELMLKPGMYSQYLEGKVNADKILITDDIFEDITMGNRASAKLILDTLKVKTEKEGVEFILKNGAYSYSTSEKQNMVKDKTTKIISEIHSNYINIVTSMPVSITLVTNSMKSVGAKVDPFESVSKQIDRVVKALGKELQLKKSKLDYYIKAPISLAGSLITVCKRMGDMEDENYGGEFIEIKGSVKAHEMEPFTAALNRATKNQSFELVFPGRAEKVEEEKGKGKGYNKKKNNKKK